jgi:hypothetical protein
MLKRLSLRFYAQNTIAIKMDRRNFLFSNFKMMVLTGLMPSISSCIKSDMMNPLSFDPTGSYVQFNMYGAPPRWIFDNFLQPTQNHKTISQAMVGTIFDNDHGDVKMKLTSKNGYLVPSFWDRKWKDGRSTSTLLNNMITVRGIDSNAGGHPKGSIKTIRPDFGKQSIHGLISDHLQTPLPSMICGSNPAVRAYHSSKRNGIFADLSSDSIMRQILSPFVLAEKKNLFGKNNNRDKILKESISNLKKVFGEDKYISNIRSTLELFIDNIDPFIYEYDLLVEKYKKLIQMNIMGFEKLGISKLNFPILDESKFKKGIKEEEWGRYKIDHDNFLRGDNIEEMFSTVDLGYMPHQFAACEFLLTRGLTNNVMISTPNEMGYMMCQCLNISNLSKDSFIKNKSVSHPQKMIKVTMDTHHTGTIIQTIASTKFFQGLSVCIDEFSRSLRKIKMGNSDLFSKSLFHLTSEFERIPQEFQVGSDHNDHSHTSTFISGAINNFKIIGNINIGDNKLGTIGTAGIMKDLNRTLLPKDIYHSVCEFMKIEAPLPRSKNIIKWENETIVPNISECENVEGKSK